MDDHHHPVTDVTLGDENVVFKGMEMANFGAVWEASCHCMGSSAIPHIIARRLMPASIESSRQQRDASSSAHPTKGGAEASLPTAHISLNVAGGGELIKLGTGFGSRTDGHDTNFS